MIKCFKLLTRAVAVPLPVRRSIPAVPVAGAGLRLGVDLPALKSMHVRINFDLCKFISCIYIYFSDVGSLCEISLRINSSARFGHGDDAASLAPLILANTHFVELLMLFGQNRGQWPGAHRWPDRLAVGAPPSGGWPRSRELMNRHPPPTQGASRCPHDRSRASGARRLIVAAAANALPVAGAGAPPPCHNRAGLRNLMGQPMRSPP